MNASSQLQETHTRGLSFVVFFGIFAPLIYFLADLYKFPFFTYFTATGEIFLGWRPFSEESGPAMYWYGWILASTIISSILSFIFTFGITLRTQSLVLLLNLTWLSIFSIVPFLIYSLKFYWK